VWTWPRGDDELDHALFFAVVMPQRQKGRELTVMARDRLIETAIANWGGRFISNGVPFADFQEVTADLERWEDWCRAWSERGL